MLSFIPIGKEARVSQEGQTLKLTGDLIWDLLQLIKQKSQLNPPYPRGLNHSGGHALLGLPDLHR